MLLKAGSSGEQVKALQRGLKMLCCYGGTPDGKYGGGTEAAVQKFQKQQGIEADGIVGDETWRCLVEELFSLGTALKEQGFYKGYVSGAPSVKLYEALCAFQRARGLQPDGMAGAATRARLFRYGESVVFPLGLGSKGDYVWNLQYALFALCCNPGGMDGVYGSATAEAVRKYRKRYGFPDNVVVDSTLFEHSKEKIRRIQRALREKGYPTAAEEGYADANLIEQIRAYQKQNWLTADGQVGPATEELLFGAVQGDALDSLPLKRKSRGERVQNLQYALRMLCIDPNGTDGIFGGGTEAAVKKYQKRSQLAESGVVDTALWGRLSAEIKPLQEALRNKGYSCRTDGVVDTACYQAVLDFQRKHALSADGMIGKGTKTLLFGDANAGGTLSAVLREGSSGSLTRYLQQLLAEQNYAVTVDGVFGAEMKRAVENFQQKHGLTSDGIFGAQSWKKLFEVRSKLVLFSDTMRFVQAAEAELQLGFAEDYGNNITPYGEWYGLNGEPWCAMFVSYCAYRANMLPVFVPRFAYCPDGVNYYRKMKRYYKRDSGYIPKKGDVIFFYNYSKGRVAHTGIVVEGDARGIFVIDGNGIENSVRKSWHSLKEDTIDGYGDNGGKPVYGSLITELEAQEKADQLALEFVKGVMVSPELVQKLESWGLDKDVFLYQNVDSKLSVKVSRGASWYLSCDENASLDISSDGVEMTSRLGPISLSFGGLDAGTRSKLSSLSLELEGVPGRIEISAEGAWLKVSLVFEKTFRVAENMDFNYSVGLTLWVHPDTTNLPPAVSMEAYEATIYNIRTLQGTVRYEGNPAVLIASAGVLAVVLLVVFVQRAEASEVVTETMIENVVKIHERTIDKLPQVEEYLKQAA
nr:peptidoglycan-binding protein [uncultured Stomatobaculum sp.]